MLKRIESNDPDILAAKSCVGLETFIGIPFLLIGFSGFLHLLTNRMANFGMFLIALAFFSLGSALSFGRRGIVLDRKEKSLIRWWGLWVAFFSKKYCLENFQVVWISKEMRSSGKSHYLCYPILLSGEGEKFELDDPNDFKNARKLSQEIAFFLGWPLKDTTLGEEAGMVRTPEELRENFWTRLQRTGGPAEIPPFPEESKIIHTIEGDRMTLHLKTGKFSTVEFITSPGKLSIRDNKLGKARQYEFSPHEIEEMRIGRDITAESLFGKKLENEKMLMIHSDTQSLEIALGTIAPSDLEWLSIVLTHFIGNDINRNLSMSL